MTYYSSAILMFMRLAMLLLLPCLVFAQYRTNRRIVTGGGTGAYGGPAVTFHGSVKAISSKDIVIINEEQQEITIHRTRKTKFLKSDQEVKPATIAPGTAVTLDVTKAPDQSLLALNLFVDVPAVQK